MDGAEAGPFYFPSSPTNAVEIRARRVLLVSCHHSMWLGNTFSQYRDTVDARRAHAFMMFIVEATIASNNIGAFEVVYDNVYESIGMRRVVFLLFY